MKILANVLRFLISLCIVSGLMLYFTLGNGYDFYEIFLAGQIIYAVVGVVVIIALTIGLSKFITFGFEKEKKKN